ncbi:MAG: putative Ig domain-containing protein [Acidobacteria bacterium]|nr:putative Ig domain-containing protein [Acidobacteriota bacterium]
MRVRRVLLAGLLAGVTGVAPAQIRDNPGFRAKSIPRNDDGSAPLEPIGWTLNFFGRLRTGVFVNNNGNVTFDAPLPTYTPFGLTGVQREIIAPFFADVDTRPPGSKLVTYGPDVVNGRRAFGANYLDVGYYNQHVDKLDSFQLVLIERPDTGDGNFDIEFNYERILWETGDASGGSGGRGGVAASVGWSNGSGLAGTSFELPGSLVPGSFLDSGPYTLTRNRSVGSSSQTGRWVFRAREGTVLPNLTISTGCPVPNGSVGRLYAFRFEAFGSKPPYRWAAVADPDASLPNLTMTQGGVLNGTPQTPGEYSFTIRVSSTDEDGEVTVFRRCAIVVDPPALKFTSNTALPVGSAGQRYEARLRAEGSSTMQFYLVDSFGAPGLTLNPNGLISGTPVFEGSYRFRVAAVSDAREQAVPAIKEFSLYVRPRELSIEGSCPLDNGTGGVPYSHRFSARGGSPPYIWAAVGTLPPGLSLTQTGVLSGIPRVSHWWPFDVKAEDSAGNTAQLGCGVVILFPEVQVTGACPLPSATAGVAYSQRMTATGGSGPYVWSATGNLPAGLRLAQDGTLSGTPLVTGASQFRLRVNDGRGQAAGAACSLIVNPGDYGIATCPLPDAYTGEPYTQKMSVVGGVEPFYWSEWATLPAGLRISAEGYLSGTLKTVGTYPVSLRVQDAAGQTSVRSCNLKVQPQTLRLTNACPVAEATIGQAYSYALAAAGGVEPYTFTALGDLPSGVRLSASGQLSGSPAEPGVYPVQFTVSDRDGRRSSAICSILVDIPAAPEIKITGLPNVLPPAAAGPRVNIEIASAYPLTLEGDVLLEVTPNTDSPTASVNQVDPAVRFNNGQRSVAFRLPAGVRQASVQIQTTGTVASTILVKAVNVRAGGAEFSRQAGGLARVPRVAPVLTNVCYVPAGEGFDLDLSGYSTTRDLLSADLTFGSNSYAVDLVGPATEYFAGDESVRTGGTFRVRAPYRMRQGSAQNLGQGNAVVKNSVGASASRPISRCQ